MNALPENNSKSHWKKMDGWKTVLSFQNIFKTELLVLGRVSSGLPLLQSDSNW